MRQRARAIVPALLVAAAAACARIEAPIGGPPDSAPPRLVRVTPESGSVARDPSDVVFQFDEVIEERPSGSSSLADLVLVSPRDGDPRVRWRRTALTVRPRRGWRDSTTYVVTVQPGLMDIRGNRLDSSLTTVFSTGGPIVNTRIEGVVFDWAAGTPLANAVVLGITRPDPAGGARADSVIYVAVADSSGRFVLPHVRPGVVTVFGVADQNRSFGVDPREAFDSTQVTLRDSLRVELYAFVHDTLGPVPRTVAARDSVTLVLTFSQPLLPTDTVSVTQFAVVGPDSQAVPLTLAQPRPLFDSLQARAADTLAAPADTVIATPDTLAAADTARPRLSRPVPPTEVVLRLASPLQPATTYEVRARGLRNLLGRPGEGSTRLTTPDAPAAPAAPPPDSAGTRRR